MMRSDEAIGRGRDAVTLAVLAVMVSSCRGEHAKPARSSAGHDTAMDPATNDARGKLDRWTAGKQARVS